MAGAKKSLKEVTGRDKEIRVRYVKPETFKALAECSRLLREKFIPDTVVKLIHNYKSDQNLISQLQARNNKLNASLLSLVNEREKMSRLLSDFIKNTDRFNEMTITRAKQLHKKMNLKSGTRSHR